MNNLLVDLWYGQVNPFENSAKNDKEVQNLLRVIEQDQTELNKALNTGDKKILDSFSQSHSEYAHLLAEHAFCDGFSLACRLLTQALASE